MPEQRKPGIRRKRRADKIWKSGTQDAGVLRLRSQTTQPTEHTESTEGSGAFTRKRGTRLTFVARRRT